MDNIVPASIVPPVWDSRLLKLSLLLVFDFQQQQNPLPPSYRTNVNYCYTGERMATAYLYLCSLYTNFFLCIAQPSSFSGFVGSSTSFSIVWSSSGQTRRRHLRSSPLCRGVAPLCDRRFSASAQGAFCLSLLFSSSFLT